MTISEFAQSVFAYCSVFDGSVTSWIRTPKRNKAKGGASQSAHLFGLGADVVYDTVPPSLSIAKARTNALGLEVIRENDHDHLQPRRWANP